MLVLYFLKLDSLVNVGLSFFKSDDMSILLAGEALLEIEFHLIDAYSLLKDLNWQSSGQLLQSLIGRESLRLYLIFVCLLIQ